MHKEAESTNSARFSAAILSRACRRCLSTPRRFSILHRYRAKRQRTISQSEPGGGFIVRWGCRELAGTSRKARRKARSLRAYRQLIPSLSALRERVTSRLPASLSVTSRSARLKSRLALVKRASSNFSQRRIRGSEWPGSQFSATLAFRARSYSQKRYWSEEATTRNRVAIDQCPPLVET